MTGRCFDEAAGLDGRKRRTQHLSGGALRVLFAIAQIALAPWCAADASQAVGLPDWSGSWQILGDAENSIVFDGASTEPHGCNTFEAPCREHPPYNAQWQALYEAQNAEYVADTLPDPLIHCMPRSIPGDMRTPDIMEFVVRPERVWIFIENGSQQRHIYTDGRGHRKGTDGFNDFTGDSVGHWEADTLVVDTVHIKGEVLIDRTGAMLSDRAHIVERIHRRDANTMQDDFIITDPAALTRPWKVTRLYKRIEGEALDYACGESHRNPVGSDGHTMVLDGNGKPL
jgi:hypothetical protein